MNRRVFAMLLWAATLVAVAAPRAPAAIFFADDFSTFSDGDLVGQNGWVQTGTQATLPLQVSSGQVLIPGSQTGNNQDAFKTFGSLVAPPGVGSTSVFLGLTLTVNDAPTPGISSYFVALDNATDGSGFDNERVAAIENTATTYFLAARVTGQAGSPFVTGTTPLTYGTQYNLIVEATLTSLGTDEIVRLYVDPTNGDINAQTPYLTAPINTGTPLTGLGGVVLSQFQSTTVGISDVEIGSARAATTFSEAANLPVPEPSSLLLAGLAGLGMVAVVIRRCRRRS
jgi:hypothetical protein